jgi:hypothetical protein
MATTKWGRKESIIWPPHSPIYTYGAVFMALVVTGLFLYCRFSFGNSPLQRFAISNNRLVALSEGNVTFRWRDSAHGNKKRLMTLPVDEFLRRFLLHLLPRGFMRIRNFGFLANRRRPELLPLCFRLLQPSDQPATGVTSPTALSIHSLWQCPLCGGTMQVVERLSAAQLLLRSPPHLSRCAA